MGKKGVKQSAASKKPPAASAPKQPKQQNKKKNVSACNSLRDPLDRELALIGLRVKQITADGNCFFRALSDQLEGNEGQHSILRSRVVEFMREHQEDFAPFVEDDQTFDAYMARIKKEGVWAGHMELQAASLVLKVNIHIYQAGQPRWAIVNFPAGSREVHLSYHDGEHYNSVRRVDDYSTGQPVDISSSRLTAAADTDNMHQSWSAADEAAVAAGSGCDNKVLIQQQLEAAGGNVDAAIEAVIEILAAEAYGDEQQKQTADDSDSKEAGVQDSASIGDNQQQQQQQQQFSIAQGIEVQQFADAGASDSKAGCSSSTAAAETDVDVSDICNSTSNGAAGVTAECDKNGAKDHSSTLRDGVEDSSERPATAKQNLSIAEYQKQQNTAVAAAAAKKGVKLKGKVAGKSRSKSYSVAGDDEGKRPSRNKPCPCGSGRKHKNCCGALRGGTGSGAAAASDSTGKTAHGSGGLPALLNSLQI